MFFSGKVVSKTVLHDWKTTYSQENPLSDIFYCKLTDVIDHIDNEQNGN